MNFEFKATTSGVFWVFEWAGDGLNSEFSRAISSEFIDGFGGVKSEIRNLKFEIFNPEVRCA